MLSNWTRFSDDAVDRRILRLKLKKDEIKKKKKSEYHKHYRDVHRKKVSIRNKYLKRMCLLWKRKMEATVQRKLIEQIESNMRKVAEKRIEIRKAHGGKAAFGWVYVGGARLK